MRLVTRAAAAELAGVSVRTITRYAAEGKLTKYRTRDDAIGFDADEVADAFTKPDGSPASSVAALFLALKNGTPADEALQGRRADVQREVPETEPVGIEPAWREPQAARPRRW